LIQPVRHNRALADLARRLGVTIYEHTPAIHMAESDHEVVVKTPSAKLRADRVVLATNGYTHLLKGPVGAAVKRQQRPVFAYNTVSRPLTAEEWSGLKWAKRNAIYSFGPSNHFGSPTLDGRIHWCSDRFIGIPGGNDMSIEYADGYNETLKLQTEQFFPSLKNLELTHHWGGPVSATIDRIFHLGFLNKKRRIFLSVGCNGNGVALTHLNGKIIAEQLTGCKSELSDLWFVNMKTRRWPFSGLSTLGIKSVIGFDQLRSKRRAYKAGLGSLVDKVKD
jgi:glycine/D-amino acid oxidase-like deaminating enzyme